MKNIIGCILSLVSGIAIVFAGTYAVHMLDKHWTCVPVTFTCVVFLLFAVIAFLNFTYNFMESLETESSEKDRLAREIDKFLGGH